MTAVGVNLLENHGGHRPPLQTKAAFAEISLRVDFVSCAFTQRSPDFVEPTPG